MGTIANGKNIPLNVQMGSIPNVNGAMQSWFQSMKFNVVTKGVDGFQSAETMTEVSFRGVMQPLKSRDLQMKPEGQQAWNWQWVHSDPCLQLQVDDVVIYIGVQYRVKARKDYAIYGYMEYELVQDYTGAGPTVVVSP